MCFVVYFFGLFCFCSEGWIKIKQKEYRIKSKLFELLLDTREDNFKSLFKSTSKIRIDRENKSLQYLVLFS